MIRFIKKKIMASELSGESCVPSLGKSINVQNTQKSFIEDYQGLYIGYGRRDTCYPYREQNVYTDTKEREIDVAILENEYLYAEFLIDFGGRLWKLYNKKIGRDLLYTNDVLRLKNLSLRNAWFSGGVEWNIGVIGHTAYTCNRLYTATLKGDGGEDVLRFYEFERVRECYYQMDFWLDKDRLVARMRIQNPSEDIVPMYWWSNIATPEYKGGRLVVNAHSAFNNSDGRGIAKSNIPFDKGVDVSYYENIMDTIDYFYDLDEYGNKFIANIDKNGNGLLQASSSLLKGRKLFSWGHTEGSKHWQKILTDKAGDYVEIQAGLGKTQYECIPMPPKTAWEWIEIYTDIKAENSSAEYYALVSDVEKRLCEKSCDSKSLDKLCKDTAYISLKKGKLAFKGSGFGYVENEAMRNAPNHLEFLPCEESARYLQLIQSGKCDCDYLSHISFAQEKYQIDALEKAVEENSDDWSVYYQLAVYKAYIKDYKEAEILNEKSMSYDNNYLNNHLMTYLRLQTKRPFDYFAKKTLTLRNDDYCVAESILKMLLDEKMWDKIIELSSALDKKVLDVHRIRLYLGIAYLNVGDLDRAEEELERDGGLNIIDYREGEKTLDNLYKGIRAAKYGEKYEEIKVPERYDFIVVKDSK